MMPGASSLRCMLVLARGISEAGGVSRSQLVLTAPPLHTHFCADTRHSTVPEVRIVQYVVPVSIGKIHVHVLS